MLSSMRGWLLQLKTRFDPLTDRPPHCNLYTKAKINLGGSKKTGILRTYVRTKKVFALMLGGGRDWLGVLFIASHL